MGNRSSKTIFFIKIIILSVALFVTWSCDTYQERLLQKQKLLKDCDTALLEARFNDVSKALRAASPDTKEEIYRIITERTRDRIVQGNLFVANKYISLVDKNSATWKASSSAIISQIEKKKEEMDIDKLTRFKLPYTFNQRIESHGYLSITIESINVITRKDYFLVKEDKYEIPKTKTDGYEVEIHFTASYPSDKDYLFPLPSYFSMACPQFYPNFQGIKDCRYRVGCPGLEMMGYLRGDENKKVRLKNGKSGTLIISFPPLTKNMREITIWGFNDGHEIGMVIDIDKREIIDIKHISFHRRYYGH